MAIIELIGNTPIGIGSLMKPENPIPPSIGM